MDAAERALAGRREAALLDLPSVRRMADILAARCREQSWVRTSVASLDRFRTTIDHPDLEALLRQARADPAAAHDALQRFGHALRRHAAPQVAALAIGPKLWLRLNGVAIDWRPLNVADAPLPLAAGRSHLLDRLVLMALIGSGLHLAELLRLNLGDAGMLDADGRLVPDLLAEPLAVRYVPRRGQPVERIAFLSFQAREALLADLERRCNAGQPLAPEAPLIARGDGARTTPRSFSYARRRNAALIRAGNVVNVSMCKATGDFFRSWGMPGSRFVPSQSAGESDGPNA